MAQGIEQPLADWKARGFADRLSATPHGQHALGCNGGASAAALRA